MTDIDLQKNSNDEDLNEIEMEDLDQEERETEQAEEESESDTEQDTDEEINPVPEIPQQSRKERALEKYERLKTGGSELVEKVKGKADSLLDQGITAGRAFYEKHKGKLYGMYDKAMNLKDDIHDARKDAGGGWEGIKSAASVIGDRIKDTDAYRKFSGSKFGKGMSAVGNAVITGATNLKDKVANSKLGQWIAEKKAEREKKKDEPGFFSKAWEKVKSGASTLKEKAEKSKLGQWMAKKKTDIKTGATALKDKVMNSSAVQWASGELDKGKQWFNEQKKWVNEKKERLLAEKDRLADELDEHEFERRMNQKAKNGDPEYRKRYTELVQELQNLPGIKELQGSLSKGEIDEFTKELESGEEDEKEESGVESAGGILEKTGTILNMDRAKDTVAQIMPDNKIGSFASKNAPAILTGAGALVKAGGHAKQAYDANKKAKNLEAMGGKFGSDSVLQRSAAYATDESRKQAATKGFDALGDITSGVKSILKYTGSGTTLASAANFGVSAAKKAVTSNMDTKSRKRGLKGILGGVEGYRKLKEKYKLQAPEMRRAIREAIGVRTEEDAVNTDKMVLSGQMAKRMDSKDESAMELAKTMGAKDRKGLYKAMGGSSQKIARKQYAHQQSRMA